MARQILPHREGDQWRVRIRRPARGINVNERFATEQDARDFIERTVVPLLAKGLRPVEANPARMTFSQMADLYLAQPMRDMTGERELKPSSVAERTTRINVLKQVLGPIKLHRLTSERLEAKLEEQDWGRQNRQKYEVVLNRIFEWGRTKEAGKLIAANPLNGIVRTSGKSQRLKRTYTHGEWTALLAQADEEQVPLGLFLRLLKATGARKNELHGLLWADVSPANRAGLGARLLFRDTKNREDRATFIDEDHYLLLQAHEQQYRQPDQPRVFTFNVDPIFRRVRSLAGLAESDARGEYLTIHAIRRTYATDLGRKGATLAQMRAAGGWKTAEQAMRYMQVDEDLAAEAAMLASQR